jgi:hypothetical protein
MFPRRFKFSSWNPTPFGVASVESAEKGFLGKFQKEQHEKLSNYGQIWKF